MAWLILPVELRLKHPHVLESIEGRFDVIQARVDSFFIPGPGLPHTGLGVWELRSPAPDLPDLVVMFWVGNVMLVWGSPDPSTRKHQRPVYPFLRDPALRHTFRFTVLTSTAQTKGFPDTTTFEMHVDSVQLRKTSAPKPATIRWGLDAESCLDTLVEMPPSASESVLLYKMSGGQLAGEVRIEHNEGNVSQHFQDLCRSIRTFQSTRPCKPSGCWIRSAGGIGFRFLSRERQKVSSHGLRLRMQMVLRNMLPTASNSRSGSSKSTLSSASSYLSPPDPNRARSGS